jgi:protein arginine kinase activator
MENCPFSGKPCNNAKNITIQKNVNGEVTNTDCCQDCGGSIAFSGGFVAIPLLPSNFLNLINSFNALNLMQAKKGKTCQCGKNLAEVKASGFGCPECYTTFAESVEQVVPQVQSGNAKHLGKEPKFKNLETMKKKMAEAVQEERYEDAANFRNRIRQLEKTLQGNNINAP